jgi:hypothetical protein
MSGTARNVINLYIAGSVWLVVMIATAFALLDPMLSLGVQLGASAQTQAIASMAISIALASVAAGLAWTALRSRNGRGRRILATVNADV